MDTPGIDGAPSLWNWPVKPRPEGECGALPPGGYPVDEDETIVQGQYMVTGPKGDVDRLVAGLSTAAALRAAPEEPIDEISLDFFGDVQPPTRRVAAEGGGPEVRPRFSTEDMRTLVTRIYPLPPGMELADALETLYARARELSLRAYAEPNYLIGGSPGCIEGGPAGVNGPAGGQAEFEKQWAFGEEGIDLASAPVGGQRGGGIRVAVFDTSPFSDAGKWNIWWAKDPNLSLCVWHPESAIDPVPIHKPGSGPWKPFDDMRGNYLDHGLFVSGLIHAVAAQPEIEMHLIRVLNRHNLGGVPTLIKALREYLRWDFVSRGGTLNGTIINLSLGVVDEPGRRTNLLRMTRSHVFERARAIGNPMLLLEEDLPVVGLETLLAAAHQAGAIIVACAGNGTKGRQAKYPDAPACYPFVVGVAGHDKRQKRSSFSNRGNIAAPAGNGLPHHHPLHPNGKIKDQDDWLVSLSMHSGQPQGYMYWMGTSFAAPLVVGGAIRFLIDEGAPEAAHDRIMASVDPDADDSLGAGRFKFKSHP